MDVMPRVFPIVSLFQSTSKRWEREKSRQQSAVHSRRTAPPSRAVRVDRAAATTSSADARLTAPPPLARRSRSPRRAPPLRPRRRVLGGASSATSLALLRA